MKDVLFVLLFFFLVPFNLNAQLTRAYLVLNAHYSIFRPSSDNTGGGIGYDIKMPIFYEFSSIVGIETRPGFTYAVMGGANNSGNMLTITNFIISLFLSTWFLLLRKIFLFMLVRIWNI